MVKPKLSPINYYDHDAKIVSIFRWSTNLILHDYSVSREKHRWYL